VDIDPVHQRPTDPLLVALYGRQRTGALLLIVTVVAAGAGIHGCNQDEVSRIGQRACRASDRDHMVFQRLPQGFQVTQAKFGQFVEKKNSSVRQGYLTRPWPVSAADQTGMTDCMMRRAKGTCPDERLTRR
jgi:hypothetical protein